MGIDLNNSVVSITGSNPGQFGTGFAIFRDQHGTYVVTCTHVVEGVGGVDQLKVNNKSASIIAADTTSSGFDIAILRVEENLNTNLLELRPIAKTGSEFAIVAHTQHGGLHSIQKLEGILDEQVTLVSDNLNARTSGWHLWIKGDRQLEPGCSGAPVIDEQGKVLGVVTHLSSKGSRGLAVSMIALRSIWRDMPVGLFDSSQAQTLETFPKVAREPLMNFEQEISAFYRIVTGQDSHTRLIVIYGPSGMGKTRLLVEYRRISSENNLNALFIALGQQISIENYLEQIVPQITV